MSEDGVKPAPDGVAMDTPGERKIVPAAKHRLRGADRSGLGDRGWSEVGADNVGDPDDNNVPPAYYEPASDSDPPDQPV